MRRFLASFLAASGCLLAQGTPELPSFEVASVKSASPTIRSGNPLADAIAGVARFTGGPGTGNPETFTCTNAKLEVIIKYAYDIESFQLAGPDWMGDVRFDIHAKVPLGATPQALRSMVRRLLAERFGMLAHMETRVRSGYALVVHKPSGNLHPTESQDAPRMIFSRPSQPGEPFKPVFKSASMEWFARQLNLIQSPELPVVDQTRLAGRYDFDLQWSPYAPKDLTGPTLYEAIEQQLGLRLEQRKVPIQTLVVDRLSRTPMEN